MPVPALLRTVTFTVSVIAVPAAADCALIWVASAGWARTAATMYGSSETTFYVLAVYFGAVGVRRTRHAVPAALIGDVVAAIAAVAVCAWLF